MTRRQGDEGKGSHSGILDLLVTESQSDSTVRQILVGVTVAPHPKRLAGQPSCDLLPAVGYWIGQT
ncbi:MAG: hypothetical protein ISS49_17265 [Anaerolineae bacterium]|nr:hypothetical protein [Anaerolineae bacterium]